MDFNVVKTIFDFRISCFYLFFSVWMYFFSCRFGLWRWESQESWCKEILDARIFHLRARGALYSMFISIQRPWNGCTFMMPLLVFVHMCLFSWLMSKNVFVSSGECGAGNVMGGCHPRLGRPERTRWWFLCPGEPPHLSLISLYMPLCQFP